MGYRCKCICTMLFLLGFVFLLTVHRTISHQSLSVLSHFHDDLSSVAHYSGTDDCISVFLGLPYNKLLQKMSVTFCHVSFIVCLHVRTVLPSYGFLYGIYVEIVYVGLNLCRKLKVNLSLSAQ